MNSRKERKGVTQVWGFEIRLQNLTVTPRRCVMIKREFIIIGIWVGVLSCFVCTAGAADTVKIGVITVLSGGQANNGLVDLRSAQMAAKDYGTVLGKNIEVIGRDHAYNAGIANEKAKELYEKENVDVIAACPNSGA